MENEKIVFPKCPVCMKDIISEFSRNYCKLCGMNSKGNFCCRRCENIFNGFIKNGRRK